NVYDSYKDILKIRFKDVNNSSSAIYQQLEAKFEKNIKEVKTLMGDQSTFFINLTHHFWNLLCGHAQSYSGLIANFAIKQKKGANKGFTTLGRKVMRLLLSRENGRRILIDTKHMSALARKQFYDMWENEFAAQGDAFPIICSHAAVNGKGNFEDEVANFVSGKKKKDRDKDKKKYYFNRWSINLYDKDIEMIHKSKGLIGLILHEDRIPGDAPKKMIDKALRELKKAEKKSGVGSKKHTQIKEYIQFLYMQMLVANIFQIVKAVNQQTAWDIIGLGTDFDGIINSFECYDDFVALKKFPTELLQYLNRIKAGDDRFAIVDKKAKDKPNFTISELQRLMFGLSPQEIIDKIFHKNVEDFMERYYNDAYLKKQILPPPPPVLADS
ncbi:MAG: hypothetical protein AB8B69_02780, partial [Chitinophagales bacterium]